MTKYKVGDIVWARIPGHRGVWWPGQISSLSEACEEAYCKQLPGHFLVCLYGNHKWCWLPVQRLADFEAAYSEHAKVKGRGKDGKEQGPRPALWHSAVEEAKEALDRSRGRPVQARHNPPAQLQARTGQQPVAACEVLFGHQQHPRAQLLLQALQKGAIAMGHGPGTSSGGRGSSRTTDNTKDASHAGDSAAASTGPSRAARDSTSGKSGYSIPAWPEYVHEASATPADVHAVEAADALAWLRSLARGSAPTTQLAPEQEVAARQQLVSLDLTRRQAALDTIMTRTGVRATWDKQPTTPKQQKKNSKPMGLQPGTHSLSLPEDVARSLAPVRQHLEQEHHLLMNPPEIKTDAVTGRRMGGGGNVLGTAAVDLVLRVNSTVLPYTCSVTVQTIAQTTTSSVPANSPSCSAQSAPTANILIQYRIGGLHTVLQQLMPMSLPSPASPTNSAANNHNNSDRGTSFLTNTNDKGERQLLPGPVVEGWLPLGPHQIMLSLSLTPSLLQLLAPRPLTSSNGRASGSTSNALSSPRSLSPIISPSAGLLSCYGVTLPPSPAYTRKRLANQVSVPGAVGFPCSLGDGSYSGQRRLADGASNQGDGTGAGSSQRPSKRMKGSGDGADGLMSPRSSGSGRHKGQPAVKRPPWSSRITPYDPSDPFSHPLLPYGARSYPAGPQLGASPGAQPTNMGPPQPRQLSGAPSIARRTSEAAYLGSLQIHTGNSGNQVELLAAQDGGGSPMAVDDHVDVFSPHVCASSGQVVSGEGQGQEEAGTTPAAAAGGAGAGVKPGVLLVEVRVGTVSTRTSSHTSATLTDWTAAPSKGVPTDGPTTSLSGGAQGNACGGEGVVREPTVLKAGQWQRSRAARGVTALLQHVAAGVPAQQLQQQGDAAGQRPASHLTPYLRASAAAAAAAAPTPAHPQAQDVNKLMSKHAGPPASQGDGSAKKSAGKSFLAGSPAQQPPDADSAPADNASGRPPHSSHPSPAQKHARGGAGRKSPEPETDAADTAPAPHHHKLAAREPHVYVEVDMAPCGGLSQQEDGLYGDAAGQQQATKDSRPAGIPGPGPYSTPLPPVSSPTTPQQDVPFIRSQTPEGQHLQGLAEQLSRAAQAVRNLPASTSPAAAAVLHPNTMEVLTTLREKAAAVAGRVMVGSLTSSDSQLRSEPLQQLLNMARETLAACDAAAATAIVSHTIQNSALRSMHATPAANNSAQQHMGAYATVASASAAMLQLLGSGGDEDDDSTGSEVDEEEDGGSMTGGSGSSSEVKARKLGPLGGLEEPEIEALQTLAQPLAEIAPSAVAALNSLVAQVLSAVMPGGQQGSAAQAAAVAAAKDSKLGVLQGGAVSSLATSIHA